MGILVNSSPCSPAVGKRKGQFIQALLQELQGTGTPCQAGLMPFPSLWKKEDSELATCPTSEEVRATREAWKTQHKSGKFPLQPATRSAGQ